MKGFIVDRTYRIVERDGKKVALIYLFGRLDNGDSFLTINLFRPFFYIRVSDLERAKKLAEFDHEDVQIESMTSEPVVKVILDIPRDLPPIRRVLEESGIPCFEADIRFTQRFLMEKHIYATLDIQGEHKKGQFVDRIYEEPILTPVEYTPELAVLSIDIETSMDGESLFAISLAQECGTNKQSKTLLLKQGKNIRGKRIELFDDTKSLLTRFTALIKEWDPDIITGWNLIDFDLADLKRRFDANRIPFVLGRTEWISTLRIESSFMRDSSADVAGRMVLDGIHLMKSSFISLPNYKLETASQEFLGEGKLLKGDDRHTEIERLYREDPKRLVEYNLKDALLVLKILEKTKLVELTALRSMLTGLTMERVRASIASFDSVYIREMNKKGFVAPSGTFTEKAERITGGYVRESKPGIYDNIVVLDFKSMYPSVIRSFNIDPLSFLGKDEGVENVQGKEEQEPNTVVVAPNGARFKNEEGILPMIIQRLWEQRDRAKKRKDKVASMAIKTLMNSFFGVLASPNCRFFSLDMANAITHFAQKFIKLAAEKVEEMGYDVIYGDSVTSERPIIIREGGMVSIVAIGDLFERFATKKRLRGKKELVSPGEIETLSFDSATGKSCFRRINEIIRHKTQKKIYRVNQKYGETRCTEDHSLIREGDFREVRPIELDRGFARIDSFPRFRIIRRIDLATLLGDYEIQSIYKGRIKNAHIFHDDTHVWFSWTKRRNPVKLKRFISFPSKDGDALLRLLGFYAAEGSSSTPETTKSRMCATLSGRKKALEQYRKDYLRLFSGSKVSIIPSMKNERTLLYTTSKGQKTISYRDGTHKLNFMNQLAAVFFKQLGGQRSDGKRVPNFLFHLPAKEKKLFLDTYLLGDGSRESKRVYSDRYRTRHFRCTTKSTSLAAGLSLLIKQLGFSMSIRYRPSKKVYTIASSDRNTSSLTTKVSEEDYEGYVYDLAVEDTHLFADACGQILLHNTDSIFVKTDADRPDEAQKISLRIQDKINAFYKEYVNKEYHRKNFMELEAEKVYRKFLMPTVRGSKVGAKKRYAGLLVKDGNEEMDFTGLEFVRKDWTEVSKEFQLELLDRIFHEREVTEYVKRFVNEVKKGEHDALLVYHKSIRKNLKDYVKTTPPHVKAARILEKKLGSLPSTIIDYVITKNGPEPLGYETAPIDYDHYIEKQIKPIADSVLGFFGTSFDDLIQGNSQTTLFGY